MAFLVWGLSLLLLGLVPIVFLLPYAARRGITPALPDYARALGEFALKGLQQKMPVFAVTGACMCVATVSAPIIARLGSVQGARIEPFSETMPRTVEVVG